MTIPVEIPKGLMIEPFEVKMLIASKLFEQGRISSGQAATMVGLQKTTFLELVGNYGVSIFGYTADELKKEMQND